MKLKDTRPKQPMLTGEFSRFELTKAPAPPSRRRPVRLEVPAWMVGRRDPWQQAEKTAEVKRLMAGGMSKLEAYRKVGW